MKNGPSSPGRGGVAQGPGLSRFGPAYEARAMLEGVLLEWFDAKHPRASAASVASMSPFVPGSYPRFKRDGRVSTPTTRTLLDSRRIPPSEMVEFHGELFQGFSARGSAGSGR